MTGFVAKMAMMAGVRRELLSHVVFQGKRMEKNVLIPGNG